MSETPSARGFTPADWFAIAVMNLMWGLNLIAVKMGVDLVEPLTAAWLRQTMVLLICLPMLKIVPGRMRPLLWLGLLSGALFYIFVNMALSVTDNVSAIAISGQLGAPFSLILAVLVLKERIYITRILGMILSFAGVGILVFDPSAFDAGLGIMFSVAASLVWAICSLFQRNLVGVPVLTIYAWVGLVGSVVLLPVTFGFERDAFMAIPNVPLSALGWILFSALGSTVLGQGAMSWLLQRHPISTVVPTSLVTPVIAVIAAAWWFGTPISAIMVVGGIMVLAGVAIVTIRTANARDLAKEEGRSK